MAYLISSTIKAFPAVNRQPDAGDPYARHTSEQTLTSIVNKLIDSDGFVITPLDDISLSNPFAFNIHGYFFSVSALGEITNILGITETVNNTYVYKSDRSTQDKTIYAIIKVVKRGLVSTGSSNYWYELEGTDIADSSNVYHYSSVEFTDTLPTTQDGQYYIPLLNYYYNSGSSTIKAMATFYTKFKGDSFVIDGGNISVTA